MRTTAPSRAKKVVLTGAPGCGKTAAIAALTAHYRERILVVPEAATIIMRAMGVRAPVVDQDVARALNRSIYALQLCLEELAAARARKSGARVIVLDRGTMDNAAYMDGLTAEFEEVCRTERHSEYGCYDLVLCLGLPPKEIYAACRANNQVRNETYEQAQALEAATRIVWSEHSDATFLADVGPWEAKLSAVILRIDRLLATS